MNKTLPYFNSIQAKLIGAFLFVVLVPLLSTTLYGNWITSEIIQGRVVEAARNDVRQHAQQVASFLDNIRGDILYLAHLDSLQNLVRAT
ncbi:MAG: hypothetical protein GY796_25945, partial [Chloroflexi bacterium]|nr:hypothetical protein [Chloroflexota bacterium]